MQIHEKFRNSEKGSFGNDFSSEGAKIIRGLCVKIVNHCAYIQIHNLDIECCIFVVAGIDFTLGEKRADRNDLYCINARINEAKLHMKCSIKQKLYFKL